MATERILLVQGDTRPSIVCTLLDEVTQLPIGLTGATPRLNFRAPGSPTILTTITGSVTDGANGVCVFYPASAPEMLEGFGNFEGEIEITFRARRQDLAAVRQLQHDMGSSMLQAQLGIDLNIIPYKGMSQVLNDLRAGHIDASIVSPATVASLVTEGKVKVLAVLDKQRSTVMPDVPSAAELGYPTLVVVNWWGIAAPAKLPSATAAVLLKNMALVLADQSFLKSIKAKGFEPAVLLGEAFAQFVAADLQASRALAKQAHISIDE